jgi:hypothetical protein
MFPAPCGGTTTAAEIRVETSFIHLPGGEPGRACRREEAGEPNCKF